MGLINKPYTFFPLTVIRSAEVNADFDVVYGEFNGNISDDNVSATAGIQFSKLQALPSAQILVGSAANVATPRTMSGDATISNTGVVTVNFGGGSGIPVGTITAFYDYNGLVTFDTNFWKYCDGTAIVKVGSPLNGQLAPDLSGRYLVGFGTDGGGDIGTALWATAPVGNAGHTINLQHSHTVDPHTHDYGTLQFKTSTSVQNAMPPGYRVDFYDNAGAVVTVAASVTVMAAVAGAVVWIQTAGPGPGTQDYYTTAGSGNTGSFSPGTNNALSTIQSIQPRSIRCRYIIRI